MKKKYPNHIIIKDIGSGINMNRKGLNKIIDWAIEGKIKEVVVAYKDRLARFGYSQIERIIKKYSNGKIIIINKKEKKEPQRRINRRCTSNNECICSKNKWNEKI